MLPSFAQAFASDSMSTTLPPIRKRAGKPAADDSNKKRRLTHSPNPRPHPLRTDLDSISSSPKPQSNSTPISPIGLTVQRELIDQVRSVKQIRKKQEALIEQRRESVTALPADDPAKTPQPTTSTASTSSPRIQPPLQPTSPSGPSSSRLPPPPISFANRAINAGKKKPADLLLVNPRDPPSHHHHAASRLGLYPRSLLQPSVQSAPPSQNAFSIPMALPRLPSNLMSGPPPTISGSRKVPPTPTRLSMQPTSGASVANGKSPPASIPIASTLVPQTPTSLAINRAINFGNSQSQPQISNSSSGPGPGSAPASSISNSSATPLVSAQTPTQAQAAKQAFLAPFELFYDALHDARHLKEWLNEQLARTAALTRRWEEEVGRLERDREGNSRGRDHPVSKGVAHVKREEGETSLSDVGAGAELKEELERLRRRVEELEGRLGSATAGSSNANGTATATASSSSSTSSNSSEGYTFPQQQPLQQQQRYEQQFQHPYQVQHQPPQSQQHPQPATPVALPLLPAISGRLSLSVRPELGRRLSSPGWHSLGSIRGGYRMVGRGGGREGLDDGHREKEGGRASVGMVAVSKSLSGPGTSGSGFAGVTPGSGGPGSRRRGRRVSISGGVVPSVGGREGENLGEGSERLGEGEGAARGRERAVREDRPGMDERPGGEKVQEEEEGGMNVDSIVEEDGGMRLDRSEGERERDREGEQERKEEIRR